MTKKTLDSVRVRKNPDVEVMTRGMLIPMFEDLKDFVKSIAKGIRMDVQDVRTELKTEIIQLQVAVTEHSRMIKELKVDIRQTEERLGGKIRGEIKQTEERLTVQLLQTETRLSNKLDGHTGQLAVHEVRITKLEAASQP